MFLAEAEFDAPSDVHNQIGELILVFRRHLANAAIDATASSGKMHVKSCLKQVKQLTRILAVLRIAQNLTADMGVFYEDDYIKHVDDMLVKVAEAESIC